MLHNISKTCNLRFIATIRSQYKKYKTNAGIKGNTILTMNVLEKNKKFVLKTMLHSEGITLTGLKSPEFPVGSSVTALWSVSGPIYPHPLSQETHTPTT